MRLRSTPHCKSDDKRYSLDFEHQETINCPISQPVLKPGLPAEPLDAPLELWEVAAVLVELLYEVLSAIFCFHFVQNDEVSDLRERSVLWWVNFESNSGSVSFQRRYFHSTSFKSIQTRQIDTRDFFAVCRFFLSALCFSHFDLLALSFICFGKQMLIFTIILHNKL